MWTIIFPAKYAANAYVPVAIYLLRILKRLIGVTTFGMYPTLGEAFQLGFQKDSEQCLATFSNSKSNHNRLEEGLGSKLNCVLKSLASFGLILSNF